MLFQVKLIETLPILLSETVNEDELDDEDDKMNEIIFLKKYNSSV